MIVIIVERQVLWKVENSELKLNFKKSKKCIKIIARHPNHQFCPVAIPEINHMLEQIILLFAGPDQ